ncbi:hypothetical protein Q5741_03915 [Paenibacillus sp. JX-17]|uniref:DUF4025 domain-containing protein n=1 Tax=Paenibacillus lacisoli TaxID=3064525 RepID=A0ABT9C8G4_9BACL|nr:hypothetical protein [Paenibacillus sp. JX-17]MDO7905555.1 hypothetical protein [Paenibacillus sp. JX-17]
MPYDRKPDVTDGDPETIYEDTRPHLRTGLLPGEADITQQSSEINVENHGEHTEKR